MSNLEAKKENALAAPMSMDAWGEVPMGANDILIPKILPMQGLSDMVAEGSAQMGEFRDSVNGNLIAGVNQKFSVIPFMVDKAWDIQMQQEDGQFKYDKSVPIIENPLSPNYNDNWKWQENVEGKEIRRIRRYNVFCLIPSEVEKGEAVPYVLSFKSTSLKAGKKLLTQMYMRNRVQKLPPPAFHAIISGMREKNEKGTFIVLNYEVGPRTTEAEMEAAYRWYNEIKMGHIRVDNTDVERETTVTEVPLADTQEF